MIFCIENKNLIYCVFIYFFDRYNITNTEEPYFVIDSLDSLMSAEYFDDTALKAIVFAVNQKGRSQGVMLKDFLLDNNAANQAGESTNKKKIQKYLQGFLELQGIFFLLFREFPQALILKCSLFVILFIPSTLI
jgi:hypothetical protein